MRPRTDASASPPTSPPADSPHPVPVIVSPEQFTLIDFDAEEIRLLTADLLAKVGLDPDADVHVEVNETSPLGFTQITSLDPVTLYLESGALEDPKRPRQLSPEGAQNVIGRLLLEVSDRLDPDFGAPPLDEPLDPPLANAWHIYCAGRLDQLGYRYFDQRQRRLYHFRNRHGFTDRADAAFDRLWAGDGLTFAQIQTLSDQALGAPAAS